MPEEENEIVTSTEKVEARNLPERSGHIVSAMYSGPIPPPSFFAEYEKALPGLADRVMAMSESQTVHRINIEKEVVATDNKKSMLGLIFAFIIVIVGLIIGGFLVYKDKATNGFITMFTPLAIIVGTFIVQNRKKEDDKNTDKE